MKSIIFISWFLALVIFGSDYSNNETGQLEIGLLQTKDESNNENGGELAAPLLQETTVALPVSTTGNEISIRIGNDEAKTCDICFDYLKKNEKVFGLSYWETGRKEKKEHLKHANRMCEECVNNWLLEPNSDGLCPTCKKPLSTSTFGVCTQCKIRYLRCVKCVKRLFLKVVFVILLFLGPIANIFIPGFLSLPHGFTTAIMYAFMHDILPLSFQGDLNDVPKFYFRIILPCITNVVYMVQDLGLGKGEGEAIPLANAWQITGMIAWPLCFGLERLSGTPDKCPNVTKFIKYANYVLPYCSQLDFFPILYFGSLFQKTKETTWLLFISNCYLLCIFHELLTIHDFEAFLHFKVIAFAFFFFIQLLKRWYPIWNLIF